MLSILNIRHKIFKHNKIAILSFHVKDQSLIDFNLSLIENNKNTIAILKTLNIKDYTVKTIKKTPSQKHTCIYPHKWRRCFNT